ncbi:hypothetical protein FACS1894147_08170 [Spirochaetia bacterium]|nr:hypothetical protein FACS1894147_08170 [Spirochaetia bacterium]
MTKKEAEAVAGQVHDGSLNFHMGNAIFACGMMIQAKYAVYKEDRKQQIKEKLQIACRRNEDAVIRDLMSEQKTIEHARFPLFVEYVDMDADGGRVIKAGNQLIISLSDKLLRNSRNTDGSYNEAIVKKLRYVTAHEIGHAILHTDELLKTGSLQGSGDLKKEREEEAGYFASKLVELRSERVKKLGKIGV